MKLGRFTHADLEKPVQQILSSYSKRPEQIYTCFKHDTLKDVLEKCIYRRVHRLICTDSTRRIEGIVSLSDILKFFLTCMVYLLATIYSWCVSMLMCASIIVSRAGGAVSACLGSTKQ